MMTTEAAIAMRKYLLRLARGFASCEFVAAV